jgi:hypothetical protein
MYFFLIFYGIGGVGNLIFSSTSFSIGKISPSSIEPVDAVAMVDEIIGVVEPKSLDSFDEPSQSANIEMAKKT